MNPRRTVAALLLALTACSSGKQGDLSSLGLLAALSGMFAPGSTPSDPPAAEGESIAPPVIVPVSVSPPVIPAQPTDPIVDWNYIIKATSMYPANFQTNVPVDLPQMRITFNHPVDCNGISTRPLRLKMSAMPIGSLEYGLTLVPGQDYIINNYTCSVDTISFTPPVPLQENRTYFMWVNVEMKDIGQTITRVHPTAIPRWLFTTGPETFLDTNVIQQDTDARPYCFLQPVIDTTEGRWFETPRDDSVKWLYGYAGGVHTFWDNEKLILKINNTCAAGFFLMDMYARNIHGPVPENYKHFSISVRNRTIDRTDGGFLIEADDSTYHRGRTYVYLAPGEQELEVVWKNESASDNSDANLDIHTDSIYLTSVGTRLLTKGQTRRSDQFCSLDGKFYWDYQSLRTYWKDQKISYCFDEQTAGKYRITVNAKNYGILPDGYSNFQVNVSVDGQSRTITIPASMLYYQSGSTEFDLAADGNKRVELNWINDQDDPGITDANIQISSITMERIDSTIRSAADYCFKENHWAWRGESLVTYYPSFQTSAAGYCFNTLSAGRYRLHVEGKHEGDAYHPTLNPNYTQFEVDVTSGAANGTLILPSVPKSGELFSHAQVDLNLSESPQINLRYSYPGTTSMDMPLLGLHKLWLEKLPD